MSTNIRFLSDKSLAVYESALIDQFAKEHRRSVRFQALLVLGMISMFALFATLALLVPASTQSLIKLLLQP